jgi:hypothetical protein
MEKFALQFKTVQDAVSAVTDCLGMAACENSGTVDAASGKKSHNLYCSGSFGGSCKTLARCQVSMASSGESTILKIAVRSENEAVSHMIAECIS